MGAAKSPAGPAKSPPLPSARAQASSSCVTCSRKFTSAPQALATYATRSSGGRSSAPSITRWIARHRPEENAGSGPVSARSSRGDRSGGVVTKLPVQPPARLDPVARHRARGDTERLGGLRLGQTAEETAVDHASLPRVEHGQPLQRFVHREEDIGAFARREGNRVRRLQRFNGDGTPPSAAAS